MAGGADAQVSRRHRKLAGPTRSSSLNDSPPGHPARAPLRLRLEPRVLLQAPRGVRGVRRRHQAPASARRSRCGRRSGSPSGMLIGAGAWVLHVAAISLAPLSVVQAVLSGGVALLAVMAEKLFGLDDDAAPVVGPRAHRARPHPPRRSRCPGGEGAHSTFSEPAMIAFEAGLFGVGALLIMGPRLGGPAEHHGVMLAAAAGILFGVCNVGVKALTGIDRRRGRAHGRPARRGLLVAIAGSVAAFYASARSLQDGEAVSVIAITGTAANICVHRRRDHRLRRPDARHDRSASSSRPSPSCSSSSPARSRPRRSAPPRASPRRA